MEEEEDDIQISLGLYIGIIILIMFIASVIGLLLFYYKYVKLDFSSVQ